ITPENFAAQIADARTFTLQSWLEPLRAAGLIRGGSLDNAILIGEQGWSSPPRGENELARHKALDVVGDLALLFGSANFRGHIIATRAGHGAHRAWMQACRESNALRTVNV
ncbi:UDP-3-O-acyl-N-acetylglucosamine deacetylase, partial [Escherichia coli]|nr:UDP-3-O-acyl-N-acetylglucosamine deacetylase [Escherichia coli]